MKILVVSDTHGRDGNLNTVLRKVKPIDALIHCGDVEGREEQIVSMAECPTYMVAGNNDFFSDLPREKDFRIGRYKVWLTHGHNYCVSMGNEYLKKEAKIRGADIVMYGHTHKPVVDIGDGLIAINPGRLSYPRQEGRRPSYIIMELDKAGEARFSINYI